MLANLLKGLYAVTDDYLTPLSHVEYCVKHALDNGVKIIQFRDKIHQDFEVENVVQNINDLCEQYQALFILNDRVELAAKLKLKAIHIGINDLSIEKARQIVGENCIIGVSCYGNIDLAKKAALNGADYVAFGACYNSPTKPKKLTIDKNVISLAKNILNIPVCVIGGINALNINELKKYKPDMYAIVSGIFKGDITKNIFEINQSLNN